MEKLKALRTGNRAAITKTLKRIKEMLSLEETETETIESLYGTILKKKETIKKINEQILEKTEADKMSMKQNKMSMKTELDIEIKKLEKQMKVKSQTENAQSHQHLSVHHSFSSLNPNADEFTTNVSNFAPLKQLSGCSNPSYGAFSNTSHKLPKLTLPIFSGDILQWQSFWDAFDTAVDSNLSLNNVQKFSYLKSLLRGEALETITGFALTNANYQEAITLLRDRYGQEHKISQRYMQALLEIPPAENTLQSLRQFHDKFEIYIRGLNSLGQSEDTYGALLVPIILNKLNPEIRRNIAREHKSTKWSLTELRKCILSEINVMEAGMNIDSLHFDGTGSRDMPIESTAAFFTNAKSKPNNTVITSAKVCVYCKEKTHYALQCKSVVDYEKRMEIVKRDRLCFNCLGRHKVTECKSKKSCKLCRKRHHTSLCKTTIADNTNNKGKNSDNTKTSPATKNVSDNGSSDTATPISSLHSFLTHAHKNVLLKTAISPVHSDSTSVNTNILLDEGAMRSFITESLAEKLNLKRRRTETVQLCGFGAKEKEVRNVSTGVIKLETVDGEFITMEVLVVPEISVPIQTYRSSVTTMPHVAGLRLAHPVDDKDTFEISLLIGADYYWEIILDKVIRGDGPTAVQSKIGYLLSGPIQKQPSKITDVSMMNVMIAHKAEEANLEKFWEVESSGLKQQDNKDCDKLNNYMESCITFDGERYIAKLPWAEDHGPLPSNRNIAFSRTKNVVNRLKKEPDLLRLYGNIIRDQETSGFIERVEENDNSPNGKLHYIPHHPVAKDSATTPIRIVFDCSCRASSDLHNLNDCLQKTPPELNDLSSILLRFRQRKYAVSADIEKAFLNVGLHREDRDVTRFFWLKDPSDPASPFITYRFRSVLFGATCSPFILSATLLKHLGQYQDFVGNHLRQNLYVDNVLTSFDNKDQLLKFYTESRSILSAANFNLRSWASNCSQLQYLATNDDVKDDDEPIKVLGMRWNVKSDTLTFAQQADFETENGLVTKREVLRQISKIYDPMGIISPVTVHSKIFMQSLWKQQLQWDQILSEEDQNDWLTIKRDLEEVVKTDFERSYFRGNETGDDATIHVFTDASAKAYGACAYIVKGSQSTLVMAKNRVSPIKQPLTIPKLELMGALVGAKLAHNLQITLNCSSVYMWCDSQIVLNWLSSSKTLPRFVDNRVKTIKELTSTSWRYCPTKENPADLLTRGMSTETFKQSTLWKEGPCWITRESEWPTWTGNDKKQRETDLNDELDKNHCYIVKSVPETISQGIQNSMDISRIGTYRKLLRITAYLLRFIQNCRKRNLTGMLSTEEINSAAHLWIKGVQQQEYYKEISEIKQGKLKSSSIVQQLRLYLDDHDILRCKGRIHNAPLPSSAKFPILLPSKHELTRLIVIDAHTKLCHSGINSTVTLLRQTFWIPSIRQKVKSIIHKCITCRKTTGQPYATPIPPPLPKNRLLQEAPFTVCGVDFTGHLYVKCGGKVEKNYICLFTCASTRAVHLEVIRDLSEDTFLLAFRRFCSRKSLPRIMISDNGTTFVAAAKEIEKLSKSSTLQEKLLHEGTSWSFIPKRAPWYGGWWERVIGVMKNCLRKTLGKSHVSTDTLQTIIVEVERILNDRPLTYVSSDATDEEPLTPSHLLYGRKITNLPYPFDGNTTEETMTGYRASKLYNGMVEILSHFWERWKHEYITSLREYQRNNGVYEQKIKIGDMVLVYCDVPRSKWPLAVVEELSVGGDGMVRSATIRTKHGVITRPIKKLFPLELNVDLNKNDSETCLDDNIASSLPHRRSRATKTVARENIRQWTKQ